MGLPIDMGGPGRLRLREQVKVVRSDLCRCGRILWKLANEGVILTSIGRLIFVPDGAVAAIFAAEDYDRLFSE